MKKITFSQREKISNKNKGEIRIWNKFGFKKKKNQMIMANYVYISVISGNDLMVVGAVVMMIWMLLKFFFFGIQNRNLLIVDCWCCPYHSLTKTEKKQIFNLFNDFDIYKKWRKKTKNSFNSSIFFVLFGSSFLCQIVVSVRIVLRAILIIKKVLLLSFFVYRVSVLGVITPFEKNMGI